MPFKFNPFSGNFDQTGSGGGGASYIDGEVATYNDLPLDGSAALDSAWLVRSASGVWPVSRKQAGIYIRTATAGSSRDADYTYAGTMPDVFSDAVFTLYDDASTTRTGQFDLGNITAGQNRVLTWPDGNGTIARTSDIPSTFAASAITSGVFANSLINFAAPDSIGSTTRNSGAFTTLNATNGTITASAPVLSLSQTWNNAATTFTGLQFDVTNTASATSSLVARFTVGSTNVFETDVRGFTKVRKVSTSTEFVSVFEVLRGTTSVCRIRDDGDVNANTFGVTTSGNVIINNNGVGIQSTARFGFSDGAFGGTTDTDLRRDAAGTLAQRNGVNSQEARLYGTFTSSTNYQRMTVKSVKQTLSALSGASATTTGTFIPDGAVVVGVTTRVATLLTGATGYTIGDGTDADRWGDITGTAIGTTSDNRDWTAGTIECFTAGGNVTLTAKTANFTAGAIEICVFYLAGEAD